ncbi:Oidioi.mRNA.OKI2018_I69.chr2.g4731.t1.cds [Oikopleura dioica]|uniref:Oidioi.mRNA.OKI2018_I69.chr2.g4731.t1.cds n=1 Tax=Oikopleura dioica TaxID=34765 RepID=A0ABN7T4R7_OIKDI|nr:Oidioi.mRNA.OKI2018_I69.chr2.g4731.t1.cds [Oikopleura dioica]
MNVTSSSFERFKKFVGGKKKDKEKSSLINGLASFYDKIFEEKIEQRYEEFERQSNPGSTKLMRRRTPSVGRCVGKLDLSRSVEFEKNGENSVKLRRSNSLRNSASKSPGISSRASFFQDAITSKVKGNTEQGYYRRLENALDKNEIFDRRTCRLPFEKELESRGWIDKAATRKRKASKKSYISRRERGYYSLAMTEHAVDEATDALDARLKSEDPKIAFFATVDVSKGLVSYDNFSSSTIINHFEEGTTFVHKQNLTETIQKRYGASAPYFKETVLAEDTTDDQMKNVKTTVYKGLLRSFALYTTENYTINYRSHDQIKFALSQLDNFNADSKKWKKLEKFFLNARYTGKIIKISTGDLEEIQKHVTSESCEEENIWIVKPCLSSRGRGIKVTNQCSEVLKHIENIISDNADKEYFPVMVQKYIEKPLLIHKRKFDIRQWFMLHRTDENLDIYIYDGSYLRFSGQHFSLDDFDEFIHLTNHSIQVGNLKRTKHEIELLKEEQSMSMLEEMSGQRLAKLRSVAQKGPHEFIPSSCIWSNETFRTWLLEKNEGEDVWRERIFPAMKDVLREVVRDSLEDYSYLRPNTFEFFGADFMIDKQNNVFLLEINKSPDPSQNTRTQKNIFDGIASDTIKILIDREKDKTASIGNFIQL